NNDYLSTRDIGFDTKNLLCTYTTDKIAKNRETVRTKLLANPNIKDIAWTTQDFISVGRMTWGRPNLDNQEEVFYYTVCPVSWNFLDFMGIEVTDGRNFAENDEQCENGTIIFNETARKAFNLTTESRIQGHINDKCELAGFCNDFNFRPLQYGISNFAFYIFGKETWGWLLRKLYIRTTDEADEQSTINYIHTTLTSIDPDYEITNPGIVTFEQEVSQQYKVEQTVFTMVSLFTIIAIIISVMGIFGIVLFDTERRRKEIGIRKVNGATVMEILQIFNRKFLIITAICTAIAIPIAYLIVNAYFSSYTYHYAINIWPFVFGVIISAAITVIVVSGASYHAANENPVNTLKTE
ncbi:MAG: FtsX-like permease family protein, partial [Bacteroidales bacterium]|nr:FtsX-like permease family protein [Bacteroidales bacterium]